MTDFPSTSRLLGAMVNELDLSVGAQISIGYRGRVVFDQVLGEDGLGRPMTRDSLFAIYCSTKPLLALSAAVLHESGLLHYDARLGNLLPGASDWVADITVRQILSHTAGLHRTSGIAVNLFPESRWFEWVNNQGPPEGFLPGRDAAYSEFEGWYLLGMVVESCSGQVWPDFVRDNVIAPLAATGDLFLPFAPAELEQEYHRLGVNVDLRHDRPVPMLLERTDRIATRLNPAFGGYGNARGLERMYRSLLAVLNGGHDAGPITTELLRRTLTPSRARLYDHTLDRECRFGLGWMIDLQDHRFGTHCSAASFGHSGNLGMSFGFADPAHDLSVGIVWNGMVDRGEALDWRRTRIVDAVYADLGLDRQPGSSAEPPQASRRRDVFRSKGRRPVLKGADPTAAVNLAGVTKQFGKRTVLHGVDLQVTRGQLVAVLGPNGAGKTSLIELVTGHRRPNAGTVRVLGSDPALRVRELRQQIGVQLQTSALEPDGRVAELVRHIAALYPQPRPIPELVECLGLEARSADAVRGLSGGERRRLELAMALVGDPELLILDEPTTGIDPASRRVIWSTIDAARSQGKTVLLTTHMVQEASAVADRVIILNDGRVAADGSPRELLAGKVSTVQVELPGVEAIPPAIAGTCLNATRTGRVWRFETVDGPALTRELLMWSHAEGHHMASIEVQPPSLEDYYLALLGDGATT